MKKYNSIAHLRESILVLEIQQANQAALVKEEFKQTIENLNPVNILKNKFKNVISNPDLKTNVLNTILGFTSGMIAKKLFLGKSDNPLKKLFGIILEVTVANKVAKNAEQIKSTGIHLINSALNKKDTII